MAGSATLVLSIVADTRDAVRGLNDTENAAGKFKNTVGKLALPAAAAGGARCSPSARPLPTPRRTSSRRSVPWTPSTARPRRR